MNKNINLKLTIAFRSPFIVSSGFGIAGLVDSSTVKNRDNIVYLPASSIKGKIKSEFKKNMEALNAGYVCNSIVSHKKDICQHKDMKNACVICRIFGSEFYDGSLVFEDALIDINSMNILSKIERNKTISSCQSSTRTGIKINRLLKTTEEGAMLTLESVNPAIILTSHVFGSCNITDEEYSYFKGTIQTITHFGGNKGRGMGRCDIEITEI